jgi:hypothetical protein
MYRQLSEEDLYPSYEEQMARYRKIWAKEHEDDAHGNTIPYQLFWEIIDFFAQQSREDLWRLIHKYSIKKINRDETRIPEDHLTQDAEMLLLYFFCANSVDELREFRDTEIRQTKNS